MKLTRHTPPDMTPHLDGLQAALNKALVGHDPFHLGPLLAAVSLHNGHLTPAR